MTDVGRVMGEFPGEGKGVLEILRNPWDESKTILLVEGRDEWRVKAGSVMLADDEKINNYDAYFRLYLPNDPNVPLDEKRIHIHIDKNELYVKMEV